MQVKHGLARILGSCNFCRRGKLSSSGFDLIYPYKEVYEIEGDSIRVRMCADCAEQVKDIDALVDATKIIKELTMYD